MKTLRRAIRLLCCGLAISARVAPDTVTTTQIAAVQVFPAGKLSVPPSVTLMESGAAFSPFMGSMQISFRARTTAVGGGTVTVQATSDFTPSGGPTVGSGALRYTCAGSSLGAGCAGTQTLSTASQTPVVAIPAGTCTGGGGSCSAADPAAVQIELSLENASTMATGTYSAQLTFTISST